MTRMSIAAITAVCMVSSANALNTPHGGRRTTGVENVGVPLLMSEPVRIASRPARRKAMAAAGK